MWQVGLRRCGCRPWSGVTADRPAEPSRGTAHPLHVGCVGVAGRDRFREPRGRWGHPWAVQRFLTGRHGSTDRRVELPVPGPVTKIVHSADSGWLACQVAPHAGNRTQVWGGAHRPAGPLGPPRRGAGRCLCRTHRVGREPGRAHRDRRGRRRGGAVGRSADAGGRHARPPRGLLPRRLVGPERHCCGWGLADTANCCSNATTELVSLCCRRLRIPHRHGRPLDDHDCSAYSAVTGRRGVERGGAGTSTSGRWCAAKRRGVRAAAGGRGLRGGCLLPSAAERDYCGLDESSSVTTTRPWRCCGTTRG